MSVTASLRRKPKVFYGWWVVAASTASHALTAGTYTYGASAFFKPMAAELKASRTAISGAFSLSRLEGGVLGPVEGFLIDRLGTRKFMLVGLALFGTGFILLSLAAHSLLAFYLVFLGCLTLGSGFAGMSTQVATANWFIKKRSRALGFTSSGINLGGMMVPVLAVLISQYGWRRAALIVGLVAWLLAFPLAFLLKHKPEPYGLLPDGEEPHSEAGGGGKISAPSARDARGKKADPEEVDFTPSQALRTPAFWLLGTAFGLRMMPVSAISLHFIPYLTDVGMSGETAALMLGILAWFGLMGRLTFGWLGDYFSKRYMAALMVGVMATSMFILPYVRTPWQVVGFLLLYAPAYGGGMPLFLAMRGEYFGRKAFGTIGGFMNILSLVGTVLGPIFAGLVYDATDSYRIAFITFAFVGYLGMLLLLVMRRPSLRTKAA